MQTIQTNLYDISESYYYDNLYDVSRSSSTLANRSYTGGRISYNGKMYDTFDNQFVYYNGIYKYSSRMFNDICSKSHMIIHDLFANMDGFPYLI